MVISLVRYKNKAMPKVSVIIPVYNVEKYIERCARSLFEQTLDDMEYIFVNDCTPDQSMQILSSILTEYPNRLKQVLIINQPSNTGQSGARRRGMELATGDYIIHCDADDWVELDMYEKMYNLAIHSNSDTVCSDMAVEFSDIQIIQRYNSRFEDHQLMYDCLAPISVEYFSLCNRMVSRSIYDCNAILPFDGVNMWDDVGLSIRVRYYSKKCSVLSEPLYHYNRLNDNSTTKRPIIGRVIEQVRCAQMIEEFFIAEEVSKRYSRFISYVKLIAKLDLLDYDVDEWANIFPESRKHLFVLRRQCSNLQIIKSYIASYNIGLLKCLIKIKNKCKLKK